MDDLDRLLTEALRRYQGLIQPGDSREPFRVPLPSRAVNHRGLQDYVPTSVIPRSPEDQFNDPNPDHGTPSLLSDEYMARFMATGRDRNIEHNIRRDEQLLRRFLGMSR